MHLGGHRDSPVLLGYFPRTDKTSPNGANVVSNVLSRLKGSNNDGEVLSRQIQSCSFVIRKYVYDMADNMVTEGRAVIDMSSGHLQSRVFYKNSQNSFLLCDPLLDSSALLKRSRVTDVTDVGSTSIVSVLKAMGRGRVKYAIYRATVKSLMRHSEVYECVQKARIPLVYSFSLSRLHHVFNDLCRNGVPQVGSLYLYDDPDPNGFIVNDSSLHERTA